MKYFLIAGERSGDLHGSNLIRSLKKKDRDAVFHGIGGEQMQGAGMDLFRHYADMAFMGFVEVLQNLGRIRKNLKETEKQIIAFSPDVVILIDYGGYNMRMAARLHKAGIKVFYYISPKVWAWNQGRARKLKRTVDRMFVILPFEKEFFHRVSWDVDYVGNPVLDAVKAHEFIQEPCEQFDVALLPGSRKQELKYMLPVMKELASRHPEWQFGLATVDNIEPEIYSDICALPNVSPFDGHTYDLLRSSTAAVVTSGTATLETALIGTPQVVIYRANSISYAIGKRLVKVPHISLVNLIADKPVVCELIQDEMNFSNLNDEVKRLMTDEKYREGKVEEYDRVYKILDVGEASKNAAELMVGYLR